MAVYKPFSEKVTAHNNEWIRVRVKLIPLPDVTLPDITNWQFSAPTKQADETKVHGRLLVDIPNDSLIVEVAAGVETGITQIDIVTDYGSGNSWFRLGSVFVTVKEGGGTP